MEKLFLNRVWAKAPKAFSRIYTWLIVLISWVFFSVESAEGSILYLKAMFGFNGAMGEDSMFILMEYLVLFIIAVIASTPIFKNMWVGFRESKTGWGIGTFRVLEKLIPALLLLASIAYIVDASYNPFLYFRF
jgi:alginate O-acetyltransferase complex protein AlgI